MKKLNIFIAILIILFLLMFGIFLKITIDLQKKEDLLNIISNEFEIK